MIKHLIILFISFVFIFTGNLNSYSLEIKAQNTVNNYSFEKTFFSTKKSYQLVENISTKEDNPIWLTNLLYPGIAEILMGNNVSGIAFIISYSILLISELILIVVAVQAFFNNSSKPEIYYLLGGNTILLFIVQIWSLFDAYNLSKTYNPKDNNKKLTNNLINQELTVNFNLVNQKISDGKLTLNVVSHNF